MNQVCFTGTVKNAVKIMSKIWSTPGSPIEPTAQLEINGELTTKEIEKGDLFHQRYHSYRHFHNLYAVLSAAFGYLTFMVNKKGR
jgi:hypothetical protein